MKKKPYDVYSPEIYPRLLFVSTNIEDLDKYFIFLDVYGNNDGSEYNKLLQEIDKKVIRKSDNKYGVIVIAVTSTEDITPDMIPHEAVHVADYFCEQLGLYTQDFKDGNEAYAYLVGWAAGNISNTICNELKNKEYDN